MDFLELEQARLSFNFAFLKYHRFHLLSERVIPLVFFFYFSICYITKEKVVGVFTFCSKKGYFWLYILVLKVMLYERTQRSFVKIL